MSIVLAATVAAAWPAAAWPAPVRVVITPTPSLAPYEGFLVTRIDVAGHRVTKEYVIRREIRVRVGDAFHAEEARLDRARLENLGVFSSILIEAEALDSTVALTYRVREMPWIVPFPQFDHSDQDGWSAGLGVASLNLLGRTISLAGGFLLGGKDTYALLFRHPWITGNHLSFEAGAADLRRDDTLVGFREHSREFGAAVGAWVGDRGRLGAQLSYFEVNSDIAGVTLSDDDRDRFLRAGARVGYDSRDSWRNPSHGWNNDILAVWSDGQPFGERDEWWLTEFDVRRYETPAHGHTLAAGSLVSLQTGTVGADVPEYLQYRMGGANSIRGYDVEELGAWLYGKNQCIVTAEYQVTVSPLREYNVLKWSISAGLELAAFVDWGIAWNDPDQLRWSRGRNGFGAGARFLVPGVNEIRTDVALGQDGQWMFHLGIGEKFAAQRQRLR